jgi:hypothetical protein
MMQIGDGTLGQCGGSRPVLTDGSFPQTESKSGASERRSDRCGGVNGKCRQPCCRSGWHRDLDVHGAQHRLHASTTKSFLEVYESWLEFYVVTHLQMVDEHVPVSYAIQPRCFPQQFFDFLAKPHALARVFLSEANYLFWPYRIQVTRENRCYR